MHFHSLHLWPLSLRLEHFARRHPQLKLRRVFNLLNRLKVAHYRRLERKKNLEYPKLLTNFEKTVSSQNGEDGIIGEIFDRIGVTNKFFVEFGFSNGKVCCCRHLLETQGWSGLWMDGSNEDVLTAKELFGRYPVTILSTFVTVDNILDRLAEANTPRELDLLVIDIDGNDYYLWERVLGHFSPRVCLIEFNSSVGPKADWTIEYDPEHHWDGSAYFGASLKALERLGASHGYSLAGCDSIGVNAFFVRTDLASPELFPYPRTSEFHYTCPKYGARGRFGHPITLENR